MQPLLPIKPYMLFFRGKLTVNPNTLNNEIHTYFFAHYWQHQHTLQIDKNDKQNSFKRFPDLSQKRQQIANKYRQLQKQELDLKNKSKKQLDEKKDYIAKKREQLKKQEQKEDKQTQPQFQFQYTYENWMKLIEDVAEFNRFYVSCYLNAYPISEANPPINIMDFRAFRLFHDWAVWGDSTSYLQIKATASFDPNRANPIQPISNIESKKDLYLTTKMGTNKCIMANQDTDNQDMSKLFAVTLNMNEQLKFIVQPSVMRPLHFRTVDTLPWTTSMGCLWAANGKLHLAHQQVNPLAIDPDIQKLLPAKGATEGWAEMRFLQYRYNHPQKTSSVIGYVMNTVKNSQGKLSYINKYWSVVNCSAKYTNPSPKKTYNNNTNNSTDIEIFLRNVTFNNLASIRPGILVDLSAAVMDANDADLFPSLPHYFNLEIYDRKVLLAKKNLPLDKVKELFHINSGMLLIEDKQLTDQSQISIILTERVYSQQPKGQVQVEIIFKGDEELFNLEIKDKFLKTKEMPLLKIISNPPNNLNQISSYTIFEKYITYDLYLTSRGQPFSGVKQVNLLPAYIDKQNQSFCNIDPSGLTQYTTNKSYLSTIFKGQNPLTPEERINKLIQDSAQFKARYPSFNSIDKQVFQGKLQSEIIPLTDSYIDKLFYTNKLKYTFQKSNEKRQFKLSLQQGKEISSKQVTFVNGYAKVQVYLNQNLTWYNNPRHPALESLCLVGKFSIDDKTSQTFTAIFFQDPEKNPYDGVDWLHTVGPKLKLMGLMYPSMQNIIDLYNYDGLSMSAMKRAFEIEDENNSRYMPATREMSSVTHRQIRRWLYNPIYDSYIYTSEQSSFGIRNLPFTNFKEGKKQLVTLLKQAFKIELTTIPLYLSSLYSIKKEGQATKLIRSVAKDEMKHLFIVSNLLNAINETPPYPEPTDTSSPFIPEFPLQTLDPVKGIICFHFQCHENQKWKKLMNPLPIQSSIRDQLLRFIMIQMPGQAYLIKIEPLLYFQNQIFKVNKQNYSPFIQNCTNLAVQQIDLRQKLLETFSRINELNDAIQAVVLQEKSKQVPKNSLNISSAASIQNDEFLTIGMAYNKILNYLWALNDLDPAQLFNGDKRKQFTYMYLKDMVEIINLRTGLQQIRQIVQEGEGSSIFNVIGKINTSSHFIKFIQIFTGCDLKIQSYFETEKGTVGQNRKIRKGKFIFTPNYKRFPDFPNYNGDTQWDPKTNEEVDKKVNSELQYERLSDNLEKTQFPNTFAPLSFVNSYKKILQELGFIFKANPQKFKPRNKFEEVRLKSMENTIAKMRQMSLNATHIVNPNDTFDNTSKKYDSASPKYNINQSSYLPHPKDP